MEIPKIKYAEPKGFFDDKYYIYAEKLDAGVEPKTEEEVEEMYRAMVSRQRFEFNQRPGYGVAFTFDDDEYRREWDKMEAKKEADFAPILTELEKWRDEWVEKVLEEENRRSRGMRVFSKWERYMQEYCPNAYADISDMEAKKESVISRVNNIWDTMYPKLLEQEGIDDFKHPWDDQMEWVRKQNYIRAVIQEFIDQDIVYETPAEITE